VFCRDNREIMNRLSKIKINEIMKLMSKKTNIIGSKNSVSMSKSKRIKAKTEVLKPRKKFFENPL